MQANTTRFVRVCSPPGLRSKGWPDYEVKAIAAARIAGKTDAEIRELVKALHAKRTDGSGLSIIAALSDATKSSAADVAAKLGICATEAECELKATIQGVTQ
jgi:hypothetical protein